jgi:hypothetical protein
MKKSPATFNKLSESGKSALIMLKANALEFGARPVYVPAASVAQLLDTPVDKLEKGMQFIIEGDYDFVDIVDSETGEIRTTRPTDGSAPVHLKQLQFK